MSQFMPSFTVSNPIQPSNFYTSDTKDAVFNFTGIPTIPITVEKSCAYATPLPTSFTFREKRKSDVIVPGSDDDVPPLKVYLSEAAMTSHFAEMRLSTHERNRSTPATHSNVLALTEAAFNALDPVVDAETSCITDGNDNTPAIELSQCLKDHLKEYPPDYPKEKLLRKILQPKPVLDLVLYNPAVVPPSFRSETEEEDQSDPVTTSSKYYPAAPTIDTMESEGCYSLISPPATSFQPMEI